MLLKRLPITTTLGMNYGILLIHIAYTYRWLIQQVSARWWWYFAYCILWRNSSKINLAYLLFKCTNILLYNFSISAHTLQNPVNLGVLKDEETQARNYFADFLRVLYAPQASKDDLSLTAGSANDMPNEIFPLITSDEDHEEENYDQIRRKEFPVDGVLLPILQKRNARYCGSYLVIMINYEFKDTMIIILLRFRPTLFEWLAARVVIFRCSVNVRPYQVAFSISQLIHKKKYYMVEIKHYFNFLRKIIGINNDSGDTECGIRFLAFYQWR